MSEFRTRARVKGTRIYADAFAPRGGSATYDAASHAPRLRRWRPGNAGPNSALQGALATLQSRSRDSVRKDGYADNGVEVMVSNVVGTGIKPQFATRDAAFNQELAGAWTEWTNESDADGTLDFYGQQALAVRSMVEGGETFARHRTRRATDGLSVPYQVQLLESEFCPVDLNQAAPNGNAVRCGVEFDRIGRRAAYWLYPAHPFDWATNWDIGAMQPAPVPASEVMHLYSPRRIGDIRGEPWLTRALVELYEIGQYDDAQIVRQKIAAMFTGFVTHQAPEDAEPGPFPGMGAPDGEGVALASLEPGTMQELGPGEEVHFSDPPDPGTNYESFMRQQHRAAAVSIGILYEQLTGDYSQMNDRTARVALNEFRRRITRIQHNIVVFQLCLPVLRRWTALALLAGRIRPPAGIGEAEIVRAPWVPQGWAYINPVQDVQARAAEVRAGFKSRKAQVSADGEDIETVDAEIAADNARADRLGLVLDTDPRRVSKVGTAQADPSAAPADPAGGQPQDK